MDCVANEDGVERYLNRAEHLLNLQMRFLISVFRGILYPVFALHLGAKRGVGMDFYCVF